jgi:glycosyltransferase involved in cell wall biosynthesis
MSLVKNPALLLQVAQFLPDVNFVMAGGGELLEQIRKYAPSNVTVIGWSKADEFWSAIDCALSTSDNEGMPIALIEAQLAGLPAIATDVGSSGEVVQNGVTGILTYKNVKEIAQAVQRLNSDAELRKSMGNSARERALKEFSVEKMLESHKKIYDNLTNSIN